MIVMVPTDAAWYPTLGIQLCDFIQQNLVFGPGDLRGEPLVLDAERQALICRLYEVYPQGHRLAGRRRFKRAGLSLPKGTGKTELAAILAACELHPEAPVRCVGWTAEGEPIGGGVVDPYIPLVAYSEEQSDELCYSALRIMLENSRLKDDFDIGLERILRRKGDGKAVSLASNPNARDGARTTFCVADETHRWVTPRLLQAHQIMQANLAKRYRADPWMLEVTTAPEPGGGSVAEATMSYAQAVQDGRLEDSRLFFFHRQASDEHDLTTRDGARAAVVEASGEAAGWRDIDAIVDQWQDPTTDMAYWERVWCNRLVQSSSQAFDVTHWQTLKTEHTVPPGARIVLGFDGSMFHDATAVVATEIETGFQWLAGLWECPPGRTDWQVPAGEVDVTIAQLFETYVVWRLYADPPYWQSWIAQWSGQYGAERVIEWWTNRRRQMTAALESFDTAIKLGLVSHDGDARLKRHLGNARRQDVPGQVDEQGKRIWLIRKERPESPLKMDAAMAAVLSWEARTDAVSAGGLVPQAETQLLVFGGGR